MRANIVSQYNLGFTLSPLSNSEFSPSFTLSFIWELTLSMSRHCYNMEGTGAEQAVMELN